MSLLGLQQAIALLIRLPHRNRGETLQPFLDRFELSDRERKVAVELAKDRRLEKYGRSMAALRWRKVEREGCLALRYLPADLPRTLWRELFEPGAVGVSHGRIVPEYLRFLLESEEAREVLAGHARPFFWDLLRFDFTHALLRRELASNVRRILRLDWDALGLLRTIARNAGATQQTVEPTARPNLLLLSSAPDRGGCRYFEIDATLADFLQGRSTERPDSYAQLAQLGFFEGGSDEHRSAGTTTPNHFA